MHSIHFQKNVKEKFYNKYSLLSTNTNINIVVEISFSYDELQLNM